MSEAQLALVLENDFKSMHIRLGKDRKLLAGIQLDAEQLDGTIAALIEIRSKMQPFVPTNFADAPASRQVKGTHFDFGIDEGSKELILSLRDAGLGWLSLRFTARLLERMLKVARSASPSVDGPRTSAKQ